MILDGGLAYGWALESVPLLPGVVVFPTPGGVRLQSADAYRYLSDRWWIRRMSAETNRRSGLS